MNIDFNEIVQQKLAQMEAEGVIQKKIEDALEKSIMDAIDSQLGSYSFKNALGKQMEDGISQVAKDCGLSAYNGFVAEKVKAILSDIVSDDLSKKIETAVSGVLVQRYEGIKLSDVFKRYREQLETQLKELIEQLDGAGKTVVMVTLESGEETIYAVDTQSGQMQNQETHVLLEDGSALEETTYLPAVCGVAVVCDGGGDVRVAARITELVRALLDLSANRICVEQRKG